MKIIQLIPNLSTGGAEKFCIELSNELAKEHDVILCTLFPVDEQMFLARQISDDVRLISLDKKLGLDWRVFVKIYRLLQEEKPDVVHTHLRALFYASLGVLSGKFRFFHTVHNIAEKETSPLYQKIYYFYFNYLKVIPVSISKIVLKSVQRRYGMQHTVQINNGVARLKRTDRYEEVKEEIAKLKPTAHTKVFVNIARIIPQKNQQMLVRVFNRLRKEKHDVILLIIGEDPTPQKAYDQKVRKEAEEHIYFLGLRNNIADYLACSDAFCLSSSYEGLPITLLESMSLGCISVSTPVGGIPDVIEDMQNGILSADTEEQSYYDAIVRFLSLSDKERERISKRAQADFEQQFTMQACAQNYYRNYQQSTDEGKK